MATPASPVSVSVSPEPTDDELAAILTAYQALWPAPVETAPRPTSLRWKFSGRPWHNQPRRPASGW